MVDDTVEFHAAPVNTLVLVPDAALFQKLATVPAIGCVTDHVIGDAEVAVTSTLAQNPVPQSVVIVDLTVTPLDVGAVGVAVGFTVVDALGVTLGSGATLPPRPATKARE